MRTVTPAEMSPTVRVANYFSTQPDAAWLDRTIIDYELILVVKGRFLYESDSVGECVVRSGEVLCIPPLEFHSFRRLDQSRQAVISCIHGEVIQSGTRAAGDYVLKPATQLLTDVRGDKAVHDAFKRCSEIYCGYGPHRDPLLQTIAREIWIRLASRWGTGRDLPVSPRMQRMISYLREHLTEPISRRDVASEFHLTSEHVNALFKKELGISPTGFIHRERVLLAYQRMRDDGLSVKEAAAYVGFSDPFYFSKVFKRIMHEPPSRLRR